MIYNEGAFDYFDTILCAGNHQIEEIREWEFINNLPKKNLYKHGYIPLDKIIEKRMTKRPMGLKTEKSDVEQSVVEKLGGIEAEDRSVIRFGYGRL